MEIERKYLIEKEQLPVDLFSHTNQKASWPEKNIIFR